MDKLAVIVNSLISYATNKGIVCVSQSSDSKNTVDMEDLHSQLKHIMHHYYKPKYANLLQVKSSENIEKLCNGVLFARNFKAHQAYIKDYVTPPVEQQSTKSFKSKLGASKRLPLDKPRTFEHTTEVIHASLEIDFMWI